MITIIPSKTGAIGSDCVLPSAWVGDGTRVVPTSPAEAPDAGIAGSWPRAAVVRARITTRIAAGSPAAAPGGRCEARFGRSNAEQTIEDFTDELSLQQPSRCR